MGADQWRQRQAVVVLYKATYGKDLLAQLESELGGKFRALVMAAMKEPDVFTAECLRGVRTCLGHGLIVV